MVFLDTNILVYAVDFRDPRKQRVAERIIEEALVRQDEFALSVQTLSEFANVALSKLKKTEREVAELLTVYREIPTVAPDSTTPLRALEIKRTYGIQFYDAMMLATAVRSGAEYIYTEDLNDGQSYDGVVAANPFRQPNLSFA